MFKIHSHTWLHTVYNHWTVGLNICHCVCICPGTWRQWVTSKQKLCHDTTYNKIYTSIHYMAAGYEPHLGEGFILHVPYGKSWSAFRCYYRGHGTRGSIALGRVGSGLELRCYVLRNDGSNTFPGRRYHILLGDIVRQRKYIVVVWGWWITISELSRQHFVFGYEKFK